jgi:hypothetical protein
VGFENSKSDEKNKFVAVIICPQYFPEAEDIVECELSFERNENPTTFFLSIRTDVKRRTHLHRKQKKRFNPSVFSVGGVRV